MTLSPLEGLPWVWSPHYQADIGVHVYPTTKYWKLRDRLVSEGTLLESRLSMPGRISREALTVVHEAGWVDRILEGRVTPAEELKLELPFSAELREAFMVCCDGTLSAARLALDHGIAIHLGGGFHHAYAGHGEGFCLLNDVAVAAGALREEGVLERAAIVDLDVHHGNGTAAIFSDDPSVFTFSMHQASNYPAIKPPSDLDVGLDDRTDDSAYLEQLRIHLPTVLGHDPELLVYLAGVDPFEKDQLGGLSLTREGLLARDRTVLLAARDAGVPVVVLLAGGYALHEDDTVELHAQTVREAVRVFVTH